MLDQRISIGHYDQLSKEYQTQYAWVFGSLISSKVSDSLSYYLYRVEGFFVEMTYNADNKEIEKVQAFCDDQCLSKYLEDVSLKELFE